MLLLLNLGLGSAVMSEAAYPSSPLVNVGVLPITNGEGRGECVLALYPVIKKVGDFFKAMMMMTPVG